MPRSSPRNLSSLIRLAAFGIVYGAAIGVSLMTRFDGGLAYMWLANGVLGSILAQRRVRRWPAIAAVVVPVSALMTATLGVGAAAALPLGAINFGESAIFALMMRRWAPLRGGALRSTGQVATLLGGAAIAAAVSGIPAAVVATLLIPAGLVSHWLNWAIGHFLGTIAIAPIMLLLLAGDLAEWWREAGRGERAEASVHLALVSGVSLATFSQAILPLSFLPLLPVMLATFRIGRVGAVVATLILATVAIGFSIHGLGPVSLMPPDPAARIHMVQFYLATIAITVLPAAADLRRRKDVIRRLAASEARYKLVTENASDVVMTLDAGGDIRFVSPSIEGLGDYRVAALLGTPANALIDAEHRPAAMRTHLEALRTPGESRVVEVRTDAPAADGARWIEMRMRAVASADREGELEIICAIRDISKRKAVEVELTRAARTDPLTGLANRRLFNEAVDLVIDRVGREAGASACIAIFDIDHFKRVNDSCGHDAGDRVLERFAQVALGDTRGQDLVARLGGEEFGLVLPAADPREAEAICERLRRDFAERPTVLDDGRRIWSTVSAGVAAIVPGMTRSDVMREADAALYAAKRSGRDRLVMAA